MSELADIELQRALWRRELVRQRLDSVDRSDFGQSPLASRLTDPTVQLLALPADPERDVVEIDDDLWAYLESQRVTELDGVRVDLGAHLKPTTHAAALVGAYSYDAAWRNYTAVHRSGAVEMGLGDRGARTGAPPGQEPQRVFRLTTTVACTWAMLRFGEHMRTRVGLDGPWLFAVALCRTGGALLGNVGAGWAEPFSMENDVGGCADEHQLWLIEQSEWPTGDHQRELAYRIGDRIEDAWGVQQRRYVARTGQRVGRLDLSVVS